MPSPTRTPRSGAPGAPAYYLGRPASWWVTALHGNRPADPTLPAISGETFSPERSS